MDTKILFVDNFLFSYTALNSVIIQYTALVSLSFILLLFSAQQ